MWLPKTRRWYRMLNYGLDLSGVDRDVALADFVAEGDELDGLASAHPDWTTPTPADIARVFL
jgi:hypothetical protein